MALKELQSEKTLWMNDYHMVKPRQIEVESVLNEIFGILDMPQDSRDARDDELARMISDLDWELKSCSTEDM